MSNCAHCSLNLYEAIQRFRLNEVASLDFFRFHGVLPSSVECPRCHLPCSLRTELKVWRCRNSVYPQNGKKRKKIECGFSVSDRKNTFLEKSRLPAWKMLLFVNHFLDRTWCHRIIFENLEIAKDTSVNWRSFCSKVCQFWLENGQEKLGGPGVEVDLDETILNKHNKYNQGHRVKMVWIFGGIERVSKKTFLIPLTADCEGGESRDPSTIIRLIRRHIRPGSIIYSDCWSAYLPLPEHGFKHKQINHIENFVKPEDRKIHNQIVDGLWKTVKNIVIRPGMKTAFLKQYIARCLFLKATPQHTERLHRFLTEASKMYPGVK